MNPKGLVNLMIGDMLGGVGVPMVFHSGVNIPKWNANVLHYVDSIFVFQASSCPKVVPSSFSTQMT